MANFNELQQLKLMTGLYSFDIKMFDEASLP